MRKHLLATVFSATVPTCRYFYLALVCFALTSATSGCGIKKLNDIKDNAEEDDDLDDEDDLDDDGALDDEDDWDDGDDDTVTSDVSTEACMVGDSCAGTRACSPKLGCTPCVCVRTKFPFVDGD